MYRVTIAKEYLKFSAAHFTVFDGSRVERLHGHNYYVSVDIDCRQTSNGLTIEFSLLKRLLRGICDELDERVLLPSENEFVKIEKNREQFEVHFNGEGFSKYYSFPCEDVEIVPVGNITSELLARYICEEFCKKLESHLKEDTGGDLASSVLRVAVSVEETRGQSVNYEWEV